MVDFIIFLIEFLYADIKKSDAFADGCLPTREGLPRRLVKVSLAGSGRSPVPAREGLPCRLVKVSRAGS
jgi:hypothetical protein